jgi:hypothetical protein
MAEGACGPEALQKASGAEPGRRMGPCAAGLPAARQAPHQEARDIQARA